MTAMVSAGTGTTETRKGNKGLKWTVGAPVNMSASGSFGGVLWYLDEAGEFSAVVRAFSTAAILHCGERGRDLGTQHLNPE